MIDIKLSLRGMPSPRPRLGRNGTYMPINYTNHKKLLQAKMRGLKPFGIVPLKVTLFFGFKPSKGATHNKYPTPYADADNLAKTVLDAMNGVLYPDDVMIEELNITKKYASEDCVFIRVEELC